MPVSLNNSKDIVANSISVIKGNRTIDVIETIDAVQGLAPETLNSLEKLATALNNDSNYFQTVSTAIGNKADADTTYTKSVVNNLLDAKVDDTELTNYAATVTTALSTKANQTTTYTKSEVDTKFTDLINGAPETLNTLKELSTALGSDANFSTTVLNQIALKANASALSTKQDTLLNGGGTVANPVYLYNGINKSISALKAGTNVSLNSDSANGVVTIEAANVYDKATVDTKLADKTDKSTTNNSATAWSSGLASDAYHYIDTGSDALVIRTPSGAISANFLGNAGGASYDGRAMFYKDVVMLGDLRFGAGQTTLNSLLDLKAPLASPTLTGTITALGNTTVGSASQPKDLTVTKDAIVNGDLFVTGTNKTITCQNLTAQGSASVGSGLTVTGDVTIGTPAAHRTLTVYGDTTFSGAAAFTGNVTGLATQTALDLKANSADVYTKTDVNTLMFFKASTLNPTFTGNVTTGSLSVTDDTTLSGNLYVTGTGKSITAKKIQAAPSSNLTLSGIVVLDSTLNAPSGATLGNTTFTGTVDGLNKSMVQLSNVDNTSDAAKQISTATQTALNNKENLLNAVSPLIKTLNVVSNTMELKVDPTADMILNTLTLNGNLSVAGFYPVKPYIAFYFTGGAISTTNVPGYIPRSSTYLTTRTTGTIYTFTFPAHPNGTNYMVFAQARTSSTATAYYSCTTKVESNTSFSVWCRNAANTIVDGDFFVYTVP